MQYKSNYLNSQKQITTIKNTNMTKVYYYSHLKYNDCTHR